MTNFCTYCNKNKDIAEFPLSGGRRLALLYSKCTPCEKLYRKIKSAEEAYKKTRALYRLAYKEKTRAYNREYLQKNLAKHAANQAKRRAAKLQATPKWLTEAQLEEMRAFYKGRPVGFEVDHIIPLKGKEVTGLHVPWNLQYLPEKENRSKGNKI